MLATSRSCRFLDEVPKRVFTQPVRAPRASVSRLQWFGRTLVQWEGVRTTAVFCHRKPERIRGYCCLQLQHLVGHLQITARVTFAAHDPEPGD